MRHLQGQTPICGGNHNANSKASLRHASGMPTSDTSYRMHERATPECGTRCHPNKDEVGARSPVPRLIGLACAFPGGRKTMLSCFDCANSRTRPGRPAGSGMRLLAIATPDHVSATDKPLKHRRASNAIQCC